MARSDAEQSQHDAPGALELKALIRTRVDGHRFTEVLPGRSGETAEALRARAELAATALKVRRSTREITVHRRTVTPWEVVNTDQPRLPLGFTPPGATA